MCILFWYKFLKALSECSIEGVESNNVRTRGRLSPFLCFLRKAIEFSESKIVYSFSNLGDLNEIC